MPRLRMLSFISMRHFRLRHFFFYFSVGAVSPLPPFDVFIYDIFSDYASSSLLFRFSPYFLSLVGFLHVSSLPAIFLYAESFRFSLAAFRFLLSIISSFTASAAEAPLLQYTPVFDAADVAIAAAEIFFFADADIFAAFTPPLIDHRRRFDTPLLLRARHADTATTRRRYAEFLRGLRRRFLLRHVAT